jgi:hypothetical protein
MRPMVRRVLKVLHDLWLMIGVLVVLLCVAELIVRGLHVGAPRDGYEGNPRRALAEPDATWAAEFYDELDRIRGVAWEDYTQYRLLPFDGKYFHLDADGSRRTFNPPASGAVADVRVFGGSSAWGWSSRDEHTIPSELSRALQARGLPAHVENWAQPTWQSTQETLALLAQLGSGRRPPDVVVFVDGLNDIQTAFMYGRAGPTEASWMFAQTFELRTSLSALLAQLLRRTSAIGRALFPPAMPRARPLDREATERLAVEIARRYQTNVLAIEGMAKRFGFRAIFFWQPMSAFKKSWSSYEQSTSGWALVDATRPEIYRLSTERVREALAGDPDFHDLSELFAGSTETIFTDLAHYTEPGSARVAERMSADVAAALRR